PAGALPSIAGAALGAEALAAKLRSAAKLTSAAKLPVAVTAMKSADSAVERGRNGLSRARLFMGSDCEGSLGSRQGSAKRAHGKEGAARVLDSRPLPRG